MADYTCHNGKNPRSKYFHSGNTSFLSQIAPDRSGNDNIISCIPKISRKNALTCCISGATLQIGKSNKYATWKHEAKPPSRYHLLGVSSIYPQNFRERRLDTSLSARKAIAC